MLNTLVTSTALTASETRTSSEVVEITASKVCSARSMLVAVVCEDCTCPVVTLSARAYADSLPSVLGTSSVCISSSIG